MATSPDPTEAARFVAALRERYQRAKAKGQVELHMALRDIDALLTLAQPTVNALLRRNAGTTLPSDE